MPMDGVTLGLIARELDALLKGGRIDKVQQPERDELILTVRSNSENWQLLLSASVGCARAHITRVKKANPLEPPNLCMLLRKHILGGRVSAIEQVSADRILAVRIEHLDELGDKNEKTLMCEFMGKHSNLILLNAEGRIMESARRVSEDMSSYREVQPGLKYLPPPPHGKLPYDCFSETELAQRLAGLVGNLAKLLQNAISGLSLPLARELALRVSGSEDTVTAHPEDYAARIKAEISQMLADPEPRIVCDSNGDVLDFTAFKYKSREGQPETEFELISEAADEFYLTRDRKERMQQKSAAVHHVIKQNIERLEKKIALQQEALAVGERADEYRIKGEMLTASPYLVKKGMKQVELPNYYDPEGAMLTVELDERLNAVANAQRYFKLYKKAQVARKLASQQLEAASSELEYMEGQLENLTKCTDESSLSELKEELEKLGYIKQTASRREKKALAPSQPFSYTAPDGTLILAGRNNLQNEKLTFSALPEETWLHAKGVPGSHVIIKSAEVSDETLVFAAKIAAKLSGAASAGHAEVDYTLRRYVKKPSGTRPGLVTFTHQRTLNVETD